MQSCLEFGRQADVGADQHPLGWLILREIWPPSLKLSTCRADKPIGFLANLLFRVARDAPLTSYTMVFDKSTFLLLAISLSICSPAFADEPTTGGKLLLTGGVSEVEGAAGGGLTPWAVIGGYGTASQLGGNAHGTYLRTQDFALSTYGAAIGVANRVEFSVAHQVFDTREAGAALGLGSNFKFNQDILGMKVRLFGDAVLDQDTWVPQVAAGVQFKHNEQGDIVKAVGADSNSGTDFYLSATKLLLAQSVLLNGTLRFTKANQFGLLGFGGDKSNAYHPEWEMSAAYMLSRSLVIGAEYRTKPNNLSFAREQNAYDAFIAWAPTKHVSLTLAYVELGDVATFKNQHGAYLSLQAGF